MLDALLPLAWKVGDPGATMRYCVLVILLHSALPLTLSWVSYSVSWALKWPIIESRPEPVVIVVVRHRVSAAPEMLGETYAPVNLLLSGSVIAIACVIPLVSSFLSLYKLVTA